MVPGSTLMYGSSLTSETLILRDSRIAASEAAAIPLPGEETTPPVTKTYFVMASLVLEIVILPEMRWPAPFPSPPSSDNRKSQRRLARDSGRIDAGTADFQHRGHRGNTRGKPRLNCFALPGENTGKNALDGFA